jgi:hypothetical protein
MTVLATPVATATQVTSPRSKWRSFADTARPIAGIVAILSTVAYGLVTQKLDGSSNAVTVFLDSLRLLSILAFLASLIGRPVRWGIGTVVRWIGRVLWVVAGLGSFFATLGLVADHFGKVLTVFLAIFLSPLVFSVAPFYMLFRDHDWTLVLFYIEGIGGWLLFVLGSFLCEKENAKGR